MFNRIGHALENDLFETCRHEKTTFTEAWTALGMRPKCHTFVICKKGVSTEGSLERKPFSLLV